jgi:hypothetical protein
MARPPLILKRETLRLVHPLDDAIDIEATGPDALRAYASLDNLRAGDLLIRDGEAPTIYEVRAMTDHERWLAQSLLTADTDDKREQMLANASYMAFVVSVCLVNVENLEGWDPTMRVKEHGVESWDTQLVNALGSDIGWLFRVIMSLSTLSAEKKSSCGWQLGRASGTTAGGTQKQTSDARARSTAAAAA